MLFILIATLAVAAGLWFGVRVMGGLARPVAVHLQAGTALSQPRALADFALVDQDGRPFALADLKGHWTFLAIGYTHCPDICPMTLATFDAIDARVRESQDAGSRESAPRFLFISVDPQRDPPERLAQYVRYFNPGFLGATGDEAQLRALAAQLGLLYARVEGQDTAMGYLMDHSASILLVDPQGRLTAIFSAPHDPRAMAADLLALRSNPKT